MTRTYQNRYPSRSIGPMQMGSMLGKRKYVGPDYNTSKKTRYNPSRRSSNWTSQSGVGSGIGFANRKFNRSYYNRLLWESTANLNHYRSNQCVTTNVVTPTVAASMTPFITATRRLGGNNFWTAAGGAINPDGGTVPTFTTNADFTIRGGIFGIRIANSPDTLDSDKDGIQCTVYLIKTTKNWNSTNVPAIVSVGWDPSLVQDFQTNIGKVVFKKSFLLNDGDVMDIEKRMYIQKIDQTEYVNSQSELVWLVTAGVTSGITSKAIVVATYFNLSFTGDTV